MSFLANLFSGGSAQAPAPQQVSQGNLPANQPPAQNLQPQNNQTPGDQQAQITNQAAAVSKPEGLDQFNDLWKPVESPSGQQPDQLFNVDPKQLMEASRKIDFSKAIDPTQLQQIAQGGEAAVQAFAQAMNSVAQTVYAQNAAATAKIVEQAVNRTRENLIGELPQHIKRQTVSDTLRAENPALSHPAAAPILGALEQQLTMKFPNASASEISGMAKSYLEGFAGTFQKPQQQQANATQSNEMDWSNYLS